MQIDWFTVVAQIINFLILVGLLKRFLYLPIIRAMDEREKGISMRLEEANLREREAKDEAASYREQREQLERSRRETLDEATEDAAQQRHKMVEAARDEVAQLQEQWQAAIRDERESFLNDLRREAGEKICEITARIMRDLANQRLQDHIVEVFFDRVRDLEGEERETLVEAIASTGGKVTVRTTFALEEEQRGRVTEIVRGRFAEKGKVEFETAEDLICGIELRSGGRRLGWSADNYLGALKESLAAALGEEVGGDGG